MRNTTSTHYERLAARYDKNWAYSPEFIAWMTARILDRLHPCDGDQVMDLGCGTGLFASGMAKHASPIVCVDPSAAMLDQLPDGEAYVPVCASAEEIVSGAVKLPYERFDAILVKEAIHHVENRPAVLRGLGHLLARGGRLLVVMLPTSITYPLFRDALEMFERLQPDPDDVTNQMRNAGLTASVEYESFPLSFSKEKYLSMVRNRYMSLLSEFDDEQLEQGIAEIERCHPEEELNFADRFAFVCGAGREPGTGRSTDPARLRGL